MQNKGIVKFVAIVLILVCCFYLSFSFVTKHYESKAAAMGEEAGQEYLDSIMNEKVYCGVYSFKQCREMEIGLGLDLKGGMNVILEVSVPDVIDVLADHKTDADYRKSMQEAKKEEETSQDDFISLFVKYWKQNSNGRPLAAVFATQQMKGKVSTSSSDSEVESALRAEVQSAVDNSFNVVRNRIDKFGVVQPNIQKLEGQSGRIMVEMPGIKEPERVRKLLQGSANLEFWETYNSQEIVPLLSQLSSKYAAVNAGVSETTDSTAVEEAVTDTTATATNDLAAKLAQGKKDDKADKAAEAKALAEAKKQNPLFGLQLVQGQGLAIVGYALARDTADIDKVIYSDVASTVLPAELKLRWGAKPEDFGGENTRGDVFALYALKITEPNGRAPLEGDVITSSKDDFDQMGHPSVSMQMNSDGARRWSQITKQNIGRAVAIVLDDAVYSAPRILTQIDGGNSQITGSFTIEDKNADCICVVPSTNVGEENLPNKILGRLTQFSGINISGGLEWTSKTESLKDAAGTDKLEILKQSGFRISEDVDVKSKNVVLVDDLYMSGTTLQYIAMKLKEAGAAKVYGLCFVKSLSNK